MIRETLRTTPAPVDHSVSARLPAAELDVIVIFLLLLSFGGLVIRLTAGAGTQDNGNHQHTSEKLFHGLDLMVNTAKPIKRTAFEYKIVIFALNGC